MPPPLELETFNILVEAIYDAGLDSDRWQDVCNGLSSLIPGARIMMQGHDLKSRTNLGLLTSNYDPTLASVYKDYYSGINAWLAPIQSVPVGLVVTDLELLNHQELVRTEFWADWVRPNGDVSGGVGAILFRESDRFLFFTANFPWAKQEIYRNEVSRLWSLLTPHARRAFEIQRTIEGQRLVDRRYREALDNVRSTVFLLDSRGRVSHCNAAAEARLRDRDAFYVDAAKRLRAFDPQAERTIRAQIAAIAERRYGSLGGAIAINAKSNTRPLVATLVPFRPNLSDTGIFSDFVRSALPVAMLTIIDPAQQQARLRASLVAIYRLTESETEVAVLLYMGRSIKDCAAIRNVSIHTARNQMRSILDKTGTHRQSEFVALANMLT